MPYANTHINLALPARCRQVHCNLPPPHPSPARAPPLASSLQPHLHINQLTWMRQKLKIQKLKSVPIWVTSKLQSAISQLGSSGTYTHTTNVYTHAHTDTHTHTHTYTHTHTRSHSYTHTHTHTHTHTRSHPHTHTHTHKHTCAVLAKMKCIKPILLRIAATRAVRISEITTR